MLRADPYVTPEVSNFEQSVVYEVTQSLFNSPLPVDAYVLEKHDPAYLISSASLSNSLFFD